MPGKILITVVTSTDKAISTSLATVIILKVFNLRPLNVCLLCTLNLINSVVSDSISFCRHLRTRSLRQTLEMFKANLALLVVVRGQSMTFV